MRSKCLRVNTVICYSPEVLSGGEIAGIVIGVLAAIILVAIVVILVIRRKNIRKAKIERDQRRRHREDN